jgi:hypothetical protein
MTLIDLFDLSLRGRPTDIAFGFAGETYTFGSWKRAAIDSRSFYSNRA